MKRYVDGKTMQEDWEKRAKRNAMFYTDNDQKEWTNAKYIDAGFRIFDEYFYHWLNAHSFLNKDKIFVEIGCGVGRLLFWTARYSKRTFGFDVSSEMVSQATSFMQRNAPSTPVQLEQCNGENFPQLNTESIDFIYSWTVLQHIPNMSIQLNYLREMCRVLKHGGLLLVQLHADQEEYDKLYPEWNKRRESGDLQGWKDAKDDIDTFESWMCNPISPDLALIVLEEGGIKIENEVGRNTGRWVIWGQKE